MLEDGLASPAGGADLRAIAASFRKLAASPELALLHRYETRLHLMYHRALQNFLLLRTAGAPDQPPMEQPERPATGVPDLSAPPSSAPSPAAVPNESRPSPSPPPPAPPPPSAENLPGPPPAAVLDHLRTPAIPNEPSPTSEHCDVADVHSVTRPSPQSPSPVSDAPSLLRARFAPVTVHWDQRRGPR